MESSFDKARKVEQEGMTDLMAVLLDSTLEGRFVLTDRGRLAENFQKKYGDAIVTWKDRRMYVLEIKVEKDFTGNLFLETWSNRSAFNPGWMIHCDADLLWYYFLDRRVLYSIPLPELKHWAFSKGRIYDFPEVPQGKYRQMNDSWGRLVPIDVLQSEMLVRVRDANLSDTPE